MSVMAMIDGEILNLPQQHGGLWLLADCADAALGLKKGVVSLGGDTEAANQIIAALFRGSNRWVFGQPVPAFLLRELFFIAGQLSPFAFVCNEVGANAFPAATLQLFTVSIDAVVELCFRFFQFALRACLHGMESIPTHSG